MSGASSANVVHNLLLGQQAACFAVTREAKHIKQEDDYGNEQGNGSRSMVVLKNPNLTVKTMA